MLELYISSIIWTIFILEISPQAVNPVTSDQDDSKRENHLEWVEHYLWGKQLKFCGLDLRSALKNVCNSYRVFLTYLPIDEFERLLFDHHLQLGAGSLTNGKSMTFFSFGMYKPIENLRLHDIRSQTFVRKPNVRRVICSPFNNRLLHDL